jgi:hypothetical protein
MRDVLERLGSDADKVQWLPSYVTDLTGQRTEYFVLHFPETPDILDLDPGETICDEGILIRPCISLKKAERHRYFSIRGLEVATVVHQSVKQALEEARVQGMEFHSIRQR